MSQYVPDVSTPFDIILVLVVLLIVDSREQAIFIPADVEHEALGGARSGLANVRWTEAKSTHFSFRTVLYHTLAPSGVGMVAPIVLKALRAMTCMRTLNATERQWQWQYKHDTRKSERRKLGQFAKSD